MAGEGPPSGGSGPGADAPQEAAERRRRREAVFGSEAPASADERDDADRVREDRASADRYLEERPPHHDRP